MYLRVEAVSQAQRSERSGEWVAKPEVSIHFVTETWQSGELLTVAAISSNLGFWGL